MTKNWLDIVVCCFIALLFQYPRLYSAFVFKNKMFKVPQETYFYSLCNFYIRNWNSAFPLEIYLFRSWVILGKFISSHSVLSLVIIDQILEPSFPRFMKFWFNKLWTFNFWKLILPLPCQPPKFLSGGGGGRVPIPYPPKAQ